MQKDYVFLDEKGNDISNIVFFDIGVKITNPNGEWECVGFVSNIETTTTKQTVFEKIFNISHEPEKKAKEFYIFKKKN